MATDYNNQRNKLYTRLLSTKNQENEFFLDKEYSFVDFYKRFFSSEKGVEDLYGALTKTKTATGELFLDPTKFTIANFYFSFGCDLSFAPKEYCIATQTKFTGQYVDRKAKLSITDTAGNLNYSLTLDKEYEIPVIKQKIDPKLNGNLSKEVGDLYVDEKSWGEVRFYFIDDGTGQIKQINVEVVGKFFRKEKILVSYNFTKVSSTPSPTTPETTTDEDGITWTEVLKGTWDALKSAGYWVVDRGGKLLAAVRDGKHVKEKDSVNVFKCIDDWNTSKNYYTLSKGFDGKTRFAFEITDEKLNGKFLKIVYYPDNIVSVQYEGTNNQIPNGTGKWECNSDGIGYSITLKNRAPIVYGKKKELGTQSNDENQTKTLPSFSESCRSVKKCPTVDEVINKGKSFKICMKCPEIEKLQKTPLLNQFYNLFLKENNKQLKTDEYFGPIMKAAVQRYQLNVFGNSTGIIDAKTYNSIVGDKPIETITPKPRQAEIIKPVETKVDLEMVTSNTDL